MPSQAKLLFDRHLTECREAITLYEHLERTSIYKPEFSLRFVWIATISALDHYVSQLVIERATQAFSNNEALMPKLMADAMTFSDALDLKKSNSVDSILLFRRIIINCLSYKSFQSPAKVADGLSYIWSEKHKWQLIAKNLGIPDDTIKETLSNIVDRRNLIAHNADYDEARGAKTPINKHDALKVIDFISSIVRVIDTEIYP